MTIQVDANTLWLVIAALVVGVLAALSITVWIFFRRTSSTSDDRREIEQRWQRIEALAAAHQESALRHAVIEADSVFDLALKLKFFGGKDFGGRLKTAQARYPRLRSVWSAHALRNRLVHETGTTLTAAEARRAITLFRSGLRELRMF